MRAFRADTLTDLHQKLCHTIVNADKDKLDVISSVDIAIHNTISEAKSMEWDFDLKSMWLTSSRWSMMAKQYIDPVELKLWIDKSTSKIGTKHRGIAMLRTKTVAAQGGPAQGNKERRRWGSCMIGISYKALPEPQITLYSRTSYLGYLAALDLSIAWMCGKYLAKEMNFEVEDLKFVWMNESLQFHNFKSLAYLLNHPEEDQRENYRHILMTKDLDEEDDLPTGLRFSRKWLQSMMKLDDDDKTLGDMNYNTYRRIRRRFHTEVYGFEYAEQFEGWSYYKKGPKEGEKKEFFAAYKILPHMSIHDLDFTKIGMPLNREYGKPYDNDNDYDPDEEDDE